MFTIHILSDSLGNTARDLIKATLAQFDLSIAQFETLRHPFIQSKEEIESIINHITNHDDIIIQTLVDKELASHSLNYAYQKNIIVFDVMTPLLETLSIRLNQTPKNSPGIIRRIDDLYFNRVQAIEFTVKYDDGKDITGIFEADVILIGVSRTSKTPLSMYLANQNLKVMNIPIVPESPIPQALFEVDPRKIIGLTNSLEKLNSIRHERLKSLGILPSLSDYSTQERILQELDYAESLMKKLRCPIINVENKAIEETAEIIMDLLKESGLSVNPL